MSFDPYAPYGPLVESTIRVVTWNVWGRYGPDPEARQAALEQALEQTKPDLVCLVEAWRQGDSTQPARIAARLGLPHHTFAGDREQKREHKQEDWVSGIGDFNAGPDSDEIRMLTGRSAPAAPGMVFYDAWELAGDDSPGFTWSNRNPLAAAGLYPDRRFDYIFTAWPRRGGAGHPVRCSLLGVRVPGDQQVSDHYGLTADLRY
jgi:endonuclease/exonuclease/phosphatase family metal-dependent hydrolase